MLHKYNGLILLLMMLSAGCALRDVEIPFIPGLGPHKMDIQQGNVVTKDMLDKLQPGMTRNQVRFVLGTPLLVDPFRSDRWDYTYSLNKAGERVEPRLLKVFFKDDKMVRYEGDSLAAAKAGAAAAKPAAADVKGADKPAAEIKPAAAQPPKPASEPPVVAVPKPAAAEPAPAAPAPSTPAREAAGDAKIKLRLAPSEGEPAKAAERAPEPPPVSPQQPAAAQQPAAPEPLESPPLPRLSLPPEPGEKPGPPATTPDSTTRPQ